MSFKEHDKRTFVIDTANAYTDRRISKREFLRRMGLAGIGFSSFGLATLGGARRGPPGFGVAPPAYAADTAGLPDNHAKSPKEVGSPYRWTPIQLTSEANAPRIVANQITK